MMTKMVLPAAKRSRIQVNFHAMEISPSDHDKILDLGWLRSVIEIIVKFLGLKAVSCLIESPIVFSDDKSGILKSDYFAAQFFEGASFMLRIDLASNSVLVIISSDLDVRHEQLNKEVVANLKKVTVISRNSTVYF